MWVDGWDEDVYPGAHPVGGQITAYMDVDVTASLCPPSATLPLPDADLLPQYRWEIGRPAQKFISPGVPDERSNPYSHVAHIVKYYLSDPDGAGPLTEVEDYVYRVSGGDRASCTAFLYDKTLRLKNPDSGNDTPQQNWEEIATVPVPRIFANLVVLSDGSLFFTGGWAGADFVRVPMRFEPEELFPNSDKMWHDLPEEALNRGEHAIAFLFPDGSVWIGGGPGTCDYDAQSPNYAWHTFQVYRPFYEFQGLGQDPRPEIADPGGLWDVYDGLLLNPIVVAGNGGQWPPPAAITRVALIQNAACTHHDNQQQRYIEVPVFSVQTQTDGTQFVTVRKPPREEVAPAGYYMLVVIDANGIPSPGRFIQIGVP
jgi:hypothetical protein